MPVTDAVTGQTKRTSACGHSTQNTKHAPENPPDADQAANTLRRGHDSAPPQHTRPV